MTKGEVAKAARKKKKLSQSELAYVVDVTQGTICKFEKNELKNPSVYMVIKIALVCEKSISDFLDIDKIKMEIAERS